MILRLSQIKKKNRFKIKEGLPGCWSEDTYKIAGSGLFLCRIKNLTNGMTHLKELSNSVKLVGEGEVHCIKEMLRKERERKS